MLILSWDDIVGWFNGMLISLSTLPFKFVNIVYRIFLKLAETNIFQESDYKALTTNIYRIIAVVMLFVLAYSILLKIVDPDGGSKGIDGKKTLQKFVLSIILIIICPSIFSFAYGLQDAVLNSGVIGGIFTGEVNENTQDGIAGSKYGGILMSVNTYLPFFTNESDKDDGELENLTKIGVISRMTPDNQQATLDCSKKKSCTFEESINFAKATGSFAGFRAFANNWYEGDVSCDWLLALIVGCFLLYVMVNFCFDLGVRICKLAFFQIIAPIALISMAIPKMEDVFKKWLKNTSSTYINVFTRVLVMNFGVYLISLVVDNVDLFKNDSSLFLNLFSKAFLIMGVVAFMKQAPKLLSDLFGIGDGDMKLGIKDKLKAGGAFTAGTIVGGAATGLTRNALHAAQEYRKFKKQNPNATRGQKLGRVMQGVGSTFAGTTSGLMNGFLNGRKAGSFSEMKEAAGKTGKQVVENRNKRATYKAAKSRGKGWLDDQVQVAKGHFQDTKDKVSLWADASNLDEYNARITNAQNFNIRDKARDYVLKNDAEAKYAQQKLDALEAKRLTDEQVIQQEVDRLKTMRTNGIEEYTDENGNRIRTRERLTALLSDNQAVKKMYTDKYHNEYGKEHEQLRKARNKARDAAIDKYAQIQGSEIQQMIDEANKIRNLNITDELFAGTSEITYANASNILGDNNDLIVGKDEPIRDTMDDVKSTKPHVAGTVETLRNTDEYKNAARLYKEKNKKGN